ncbi:MAG: isoprenylcysteine carboxylmethyltransferase family protein [Gammaproteobacteria bacterium]|nr:isoprenylcysteine carboxylmethyltransferase family protein [Gammaproteobacteria bacterium]MDH4254501.1 isoprenylcysteine carboxylmethyltransferase family protein [Gammaproteobacteria bacterium]
MNRTRGPIPPVILLVFILCQVGLHYRFPLATLIPPPWNWFGAALIAVGILVIAGPAIAFMRARTTIRPFHDSSALVRTGLYACTRNPMYVGMAGILVGVAVLTGSLSPFLMPVLFVPVMNRRVIRHEEEMLAERFGDEYLEYRGRVPRWLGLRA